VIVVDTSALIARLAGRPVRDSLRSRLDAERELHVPHLIDVEYLNALRGLVLGGKLSADRAAESRRDYADLSLIRYAHTPLANRIWELRNTMTAYDASFIALAEALDASLVTCDAKLASTSGHQATLELFTPHS